MNKHLSLRISVRLALVICVCASGLQGSPKPKDIKGTRITNFGDVLEPQDLTIATIAAHVPNGVGGYTTIAGVEPPMELLPLRRSPAALCGSSLIILTYGHLIGSWIWTSSSTAVRTLLWRSTQLFSFSTLQA